MLGTEHHVLNRGFWSEEDTLENDGLKAIRILVCGNTGVGKSTLINRVFGVSSDNEVVSLFVRKTSQIILILYCLIMQTETSDRKRGRHDVREGIFLEHRPDLIIHDSGGFEAGDEAQMRAVGQFVRERSLMPQIEDRLHVIW